MVHCFMAGWRDWLPPVIGPRNDMDRTMISSENTLPIMGFWGKKVIIFRNFRNFDRLFWIQRSGNERDFGENYLTLILNNLLIIPCSKMGLFSVSSLIFTSQQRETWHPVRRLILDFYAICSFFIFNGRGEIKNIYSRSHVEDKVKQ